MSNLWSGGLVTTTGDLITGVTAQWVVPSWTPAVEGGKVQRSETTLYPPPTGFFGFSNLVALGVGEWTLAAGVVTGGAALPFAPFFCTFFLQAFRGRFPHPNGAVSPFPWPATSGTTRLNSSSGISQYVTATMITDLGPVCPTVWPGDLVQISMFADSGSTLVLFENMTQQGDQSVTVDFGFGRAPPPSSIDSRAAWLVQTIGPNPPARGPRPIVYEFPWYGKVIFDLATCTTYSGASIGADQSNVTGSIPRWPGGTGTRYSGQSTVRKRGPGVLECRGLDGGCETTIVYPLGEMTEYPRNYWTGTRHYENPYCYALYDLGPICKRIELLDETQVAPVFPGGRVPVPE
jgi:hypothetical protein